MPEPDHPATPPPDEQKPAGASEQAPAVAGQSKAEPASAPDTAPAAQPASEAAKPEPAAPASPPSAEKAAAPKANASGEAKPAAPPAAKPVAPAAAKPAAPAAAKPAAPAAPKPPAEMAAEPWEDELTRALAQQFGSRIERYATYLGQKFLLAEVGAVREIIEFLKLEWEFDYLVDLTAVDYPNRPKRFEVVYILYSFARNERIRVKCSIAESERPLSVACVHATADWMEREVYDMFGIEFAEHPDLKRLLLPEDWQGFPLRRDVSILAMDNRWVKENLGIESGQ